MTLASTIKNRTKEFIGPIAWTRFNMMRHPNNAKSLRYDLWTFQIIRNTVGIDSTCIDVGCHQGLVLDVMMRYAKKGSFYAFEPLPDLCENLRRKYAGDNCRVFEIALSDKKGTSTFIQVATNPAYSGFKQRRYARENERLNKIVVAVDSLDNVVGNDVNVDFIKIDVEGAEYQVLAGSKRLLKRCKPIIVFECGLGGADYYGTRPQDIHKLLFDECELHISRLDDFLSHRNPLSLAQFRSVFESGSEYYFVAHP